MEDFIVTRIALNLIKVACRRSAPMDVRNRKILLKRETRSPSECGRILQLLLAGIGETGWICIRYIVGWWEDTTAVDTFERVMSVLKPDDARGPDPAELHWAYREPL